MAFPINLHLGLVGPFIGSHQQSLAGQVQGVASASPQFSVAINQHGQAQPGPVQGGNLPATSLNVDNVRNRLFEDMLQDYGRDLMKRIQQSRYEFVKLI